MFKKRIFLFFMSFCLLIGLTGCSLAAGSVKVEFDSPEYSVRVGQAIDINLNITTGSDYNKEDVAKQIVYSSSDPSVATFVNGKLTGVGIGETTIKVQWSQKAIIYDVATVVVKLNSLPVLLFEDVNPNMLKGTSQKIGYKLSTVYTESKVTFESANPEVVTVDADGNVKAVGVGEGSIVAYVTDGDESQAYVLKFNVSESDFAINYDLDGGVNSTNNPAGYSMLALPLALEAPTKTGYTFAGWYHNDTLVTEVPAGTTGEFSVTAKWEINTYKVTYDLDGGTNASANKDTFTILDLPVTLANPTKAHYEFLGWYMNDTQVTSIPEGTLSDVTIVAKWKLSTFNVTMNLAEGTWPQGVSAVTSYNSGTVTSLPTPTRTGYAFDGWYDENNAKFENISAETVGDLVLTAKWTATKYTINYDLDGGHFASGKLYADKEALIADFLADFNAVKGSQTTADKFADDSYGGGLIKMMAANGNATKWAWFIDAVNAVRTANGLTAQTVAGSEATMRFEIAAFFTNTHRSSWPASSDYTVQANVDSVVGAIPAQEGYVAPVYSYTIEEAVTLVTPLKQDYTFVNWVNAKGEVVTEIAKGTTGEVAVKATWKKNYNPEAVLNVTYNVDGGKLPEGTATTFVAKDGIASLPTPTKVGYTFDGWYSESDFATKVEKVETGLMKDVSVYAKWNEETYKIEYDLDGGTFSVDSTAPKYDSYEDFVNAFLTEYANYFKLTGVTKANFMTQSSSYGVASFFANETVKATWNWLIEFVKAQAKQTNYAGAIYLNNPSSVANYNKYMRANLYALLNQTKYSSTPVSMNFAGLTYETISQAMPTKVVTVAANPVYSYTVNTETFTLETPMKEGQTFIGWYLKKTYKDGDLVKEITKGTTGDIKVFARFSDSVAEIEASKITYVLNDGVNPADAPDKFVVGEAAVTLPTPTKAGYIFLGWTTEETSTTYVTTTTGLTEDVTFYAQWEKEPEYSITYEMNGGSWTTTVEKRPYENADEVAAAILKDFGLTSVSKWSSTIDDLFITNLTKWGWLLDYFLSVRADDSYNKVITDARAGNDQSGDVNPYVITGELKAFVEKNTVTYPSAEITSCDYSNADVRNKVMDFAPKAEKVEVAIEHATTFTAKQMPVTLAKPVLEGKVFWAWYTNAEFTGSKVTEITSAGNVTLYARFVDEGFEDTTTHKVSYELNGGENEKNAPTEYPEGQEFILPVPTKAKCEFLGWTTVENGSIYLVSLASTYTKDVTLYANWKQVEYTVGTNGDFATLAEALAAVNEGATIKVLAGTYEEEVTVSKNNITILGANAGVAGTATRTDETIVSMITIAEGVQNVTIDGFKSNAITFVTMSGKNDSISVVNCVAGATPTADDSSIIKLNGTIKNLTVANCSFVETKSKTHYRAIFSESLVTNASICNNYFENDCAASINIDCVRLQKLAGTVDLCGNTFVWAGANWTVYLATASMAENTTVNICNNEYNGKKANMSGVGVCHINATSTVNVIGNIFSKVSGNVLSLSGTSNSDRTTEFTAVVKNNAFEDTSAKMRFAGALSKITFTNNFIYTTITYSGATVEHVSPAATIEAALNGLASHKVNYELNGGTVEGFAPQAFVEGVSVNLSTMVASKANCKFVGWYTSSDFSGTPVTEVGSQTEDVTLYAKFVELQNYHVNYEFNEGVYTDELVVSAKEGSTVILPVPTKENSVFKGWSLSPKGTEFVKSIVVTGDVTVYANWADDIRITYELDGGVNAESNPASVPFGQGATLANPTKEGFLFLGWFDNADFAGEAITEIPNTLTGDYTIYASWKNASIKYDITYQLNGGNFFFANRDALVADLLADLSSVSGKSITASNFRSSCRQPEFKSFISNDAMWAKWSWLFQYVANLDKNTNAPDFYNAVLTERTVGDKFWFLTRDFDGFVNQNVGNFYYSVDAIDFSTYAAGDGFWELIQTTYEAKGVNTLATPYRPYYTFVGWYTTSDFSGDPVEIPSESTTLYAKWEKKTITLTYALNNADASMTNTTVNVHASDSFTLETPTFNSANWKFNGWYKDAGCNDPITDIREYQMEDVTVYASWTEIIGYTITYNLNGGSIKYATRDEVVADFLKDFNAVMGTAYATTADIESGNFEAINFHTFFTKSFADGTPVRTKWLWLAKYLYEVSKTNLASNNCNVLGLQSLINQTDYSGDGTYGVSYAFRAFLKETTLRPGSSYTTVDFAIYENANGFWSILSNAEKNEYVNNKGTVTLLPSHLENYQFAGWYLTADFAGDPVTQVEDTGKNYTFYAKYTEGTPVESVTITNKVTELKRFETLQLVWTINPADANIQNVKFISSDESIATVDGQGFITTIKNGTVTITIVSQSSSKAQDSFTIDVYSPDHFEISYNTTSYVNVNCDIVLNAEYIKRDGTKGTITWESLNEDIATVVNGRVTGKSIGQATIRAKVSETEYQDFIVDVISTELSDSLQEVVNAHESNVFTKYELGIGAGTPAYYRNIYGSVSKLLYSNLIIDRTYEAAQNANSNNHGGTKASIEFITVHYTGNMSPKATAAANASYFANDKSTSINYVTGNDGVFHVLDDKLVAYHAGDGTSVTFEWIGTGVMYEAGMPVTPVWGISSNSKFMINGKETTVNVPAGTTDATARVTGDTFVANGVQQKCINDMGLAYKIVDGQYYMGTTWWCYTQISAGRICNKGGNLNSIGIESAVNPESDLWLTWQMTAQLVAQLMVENNLDITRVVGHHFFSAKDCPQPLLENDLQIWKEFIKMVENEYKLITTLKNYKYEITSHSDNVADNGRVTVSETAQILSYTVKVTNTATNEVETITLHSAVNGIYSEK